MGMDVADTVKLKELLHSRVDHMINLVDIVRKSGVVLSTERLQAITAIVSKAKIAQTWQKLKLSSDELKARVQEIDDFMSEAVKCFK